MSLDRDEAGLTRRDVLKGAGGAALALGTGAAQAQTPAAAGPAIVTGIVYDSGPDGTGRTLLAGVLVSNGRDVAVTDEAGRYSLPIADEAIVFVIKPPGHMTPVDAETRLPRFYVVHQPQGTPASLGLTYAGVAPTGPLPASVDFALQAQEEPKAFEVLLLTDPQPETAAELDFVRDDLTSVVGGIPAKFGMTIGDLAFDDLSVYPRYNRLIGAIGLPWYNVGGNHDLNFEAPDRRASRETFKHVFGPPTYAFFYAQALFIVLDDVDYLGVDRSHPNNGGKYQGRLDAAQLDFVRNLLAHVPEETLIVIAAHIPLRTYLDPDDPAQNLTNRADLFRLFAGRRYTFSVSGHTHTTEHHYFDEADGWPGAAPHHHHVLTAVSGSWWSGPADHRGVAVADSRDGTPNGFHVLRIDGNRYDTRFVPAKEPDARQIRLTLHAQAHDEMRRDFRPGEQIQPRVGLAAVASSTLVANVFDGGPKTVVTLRAGTAPPVPMVRRAMPDPFVSELYARNDAVKKPWVKAEVSSHMWVARLPDLGPGAHALVVEAVLDGGRRVSARSVLEVEG